MGTAGFALGLTGRLQLKKREPPKKLKFWVALYFGMGLMSLVIFLLFPIISPIPISSIFFLIVALVFMGIPAHQLWLHLKREELFQ